jgi:hypothetical protein
MCTQQHRMPSDVHAGAHQRCDWAVPTEELCLFWGSLPPVLDAPCQSLLLLHQHQGSGDPNKAGQLQPLSDFFCCFCDVAAAEGLLGRWMFTRCVRCFLVTVPFLACAPHDALQLNARSVQCTVDTVNMHRAHLDCRDTCWSLSLRCPAVYHTPAAPASDQDLASMCHGAPCMTWSGSCSSLRVMQCMADWCPSSQRPHSI